MTTTPDLLAQIAAIDAAIMAQVTGAPSRMASQGDMVEYARLSLDDLRRLKREKQWEAYRANLAPMPASGAVRIRPR